MPADPTVSGGTGDENLRVLRVIARLNIGGPARHVLLLDRGLRARGHRTLLVHGSVDEGEASLESLVDTYSVHAHRIPQLGRRIHLLDDFRAFARLLAIVFRERPDVVHTHTAKAGTLGRLAALAFNVTRSRRRRAAVVHTFHGHVLDGYFSPVMNHLVRLAERRLARVTDRIITISPRQRLDIVERFAVAPAARTSVVPLGLDLDALLRLERGAPEWRERLAIPPGAFVVGYVGRLVPIKDPLTLLRATATAARHVPNLQLLIAGDGPLRPAMERAVVELGMTAVVRFAGWIDDLPGLYATMDVCALSSLNEGTPVALIEAMAAGLPVVATSVGGVPDLVEDERTGLLVPSRDPEALAEALLRLAARPDERRSFGAAARARVAERYSASRLVDDVEKLYIEALRDRRGKAGGPR